MSRDEGVKPQYEQANGNHRIEHRKHVFVVKCDGSRGEIRVASPACSCLSGNRRDLGERVYGRPRPFRYFLAIIVTSDSCERFSQVRVDARSISKRRVENRSHVGLQIGADVAAGCDCTPSITGSSDGPRQAAYLPLFARTASAFWSTFAFSAVLKRPEL